MLFRCNKCLCSVLTHYSARDKNPRLTFRICLQSSKKNFRVFRTSKDRLFLSNSYRRNPCCSRCLIWCSSRGSTIEPATQSTITFLSRRRHLKADLKFSTATVWLCSRRWTGSLSDSSYPVEHIHECKHTQQRWCQLQVYSKSRADQLNFNGSRVNGWGELNLRTDRKYSMASC